jgi:hypothetical protein
MVMADPRISVDDPVMYLESEAIKYFFDTDQNKRKEMTVAGVHSL